MQNNKLSVSRNRNQGGPRATRPESSRGGESMASQCSIPTTLGTGAKSSKGSRSGHVAAKNRRVRFGAKSSFAGGITGNHGQATCNKASQIGRLIVRARKSVVPPRPLFRVVSIAGQISEKSFRVAYFVFGGVSATECAPPAGGVQPPILNITSVTICTDIVASDSKGTSPSDDERTDGTLRLCEGVGYIDATTVLES